MDDIWDIFGWFILIVVLVLIWPVFQSFHSPTQGDHTGYVTAVEKSGWIFQT